MRIYFQLEIPKRILKGPQHFMCFALFLTAILNIIIIPNIAIMLYLIIIYKCIYYATKYDLRDDERSVWTGWNSDSLTILAFLNSAV